MMLSKNKKNRFLLQIKYKIMFSNSPSYPHPSQIHPSGIVRPNVTHNHQQVFPPSNPFKGNNFEDEDGNNDLIEQETGQQISIYEEQLLQQISRDEGRLAELKMRRDQVKDNAEASQQLEKDINDLNQIMQDLSQLVHEQHDMVDSIEDHVEQTMHEVQAGERHLRRAVATQSAKYPLAAAAVGGVVAGGPVGIFAGSTIAGIAAAVGGAFTGLYGGKFLKKQALKQTAGPTANSGN